MNGAKKILGLHHVTAIAGSPQRNLDFYSGVLGLRLIKRTVNFDDPGTYHLYYGDYSGTPGTILTFFPWQDVPRGTAGAGQVIVTGLSVPAGSLSYWEQRLADYEVAFDRRDDAIAVRDHDGMQVELVEVPADADPRPGWQGGPVPNHAAIRGMRGATLAVHKPEETARLLTQTMGFSDAGEQNGRRRFTIGDGQVDSVIELLETAASGRQGAGSVHHIAWRTRDDEQQLGWREELTGKRFRVSPVMDRKYFHSIYYREPNGILFEIATDSPGFAVDEPLEHLGATLVLPSWLEPNRDDLERVLPKLDVMAAQREVQHA